MATPFDSLKPFSFGGVEFPYKSYRVSGGIRKHTHEYPHKDGGANEKLGRKLYEVHVTVAFTAGLSDPRYPDLLDRLSILRGVFEDQKTLPLIIPHVGQIDAFAESWTENAVNTNRSTVEAELNFVEDEESAFLVINTITIGTSGMNDRLQAFNEQVFASNILSQISQPAQANLFGQINTIASSILGIKDQFDLYGALVLSKIEGLTALLQAADQQVKELNHPDFIELLDALHDLWQSAVQLHDDLHDKGSVLRTFTVPLRMGISQVSSAIFGDSSKAAELMQLNALDDPLAIAAGTAIRFYDIAAQAA